MRSRSGAGLVASLLTVTLLAGCAPLYTVCSMPDIRPPHIDVDTSIWLRLHPNGTVHACYAGSCDHDDGSDSSFEVVVPHTVDLTKKHDLVVTLNDQADTTTETASMALVLIPREKGGPCPMPDQWSRQIVIGTDGHIQVGGADPPRGSGL